MPNLNSPITIGTLALRNRNFMSAMTRNRSQPRDVPNDHNVEYYRQRARGGAGLIVSEGALIIRQGTEWPFAPGIWNDDHVAGWKKVTKAVHDEGGSIFCQLWHLGRVSHPDMPEQKAAGMPVYGPSAISARGGKFRTLPGVPGYVTPTALPDPWDMVKQFKIAAQKAKESGFDGVEIHGANGYLIHQFLDNTANKRSDEWGGSVENRARFCIEVLKTVVDVWGADRVSLKLNPTGGYNDMGMPLDETVETFSYVIKAADSMKLAYIALVRDLKGANPVYDGKPRATSHDIVATYGHLIKNAKFVVNGGFTVPEAEKLLEAGTADAISFATLWIAHPDMQHRVELGKELNGALDVKNIYGHEGVDLAKGYTDYPAVVA